MDDVYFVLGVDEKSTLDGRAVIHRKFVAGYGEVVEVSYLYARIKLPITGEYVIVHQQYLVNTENEAIEMAKQKNKEIMDDLKMQLSKCLFEINWLSKECNLNE